MENAVVRGAGRYPCALGNHVLIGPHAHIAGATVNGRAFVATGASVFNGAVLEQGVVVAINAVVHVGTRCVAGTGVPIGHIALGEELSRSLLNLAERDGRAPYPQFTAEEGTDIAAPLEKIDPEPNAALG